MIARWNLHSHSQGHEPSFVNHNQRSRFPDETLADVNTRRRPDGPPAEQRSGGLTRYTNRPSQLMIHFLI